MTGFSLATLGLEAQGESLDSIETLVGLILYERPMSHWSALQVDGEVNGVEYLCFGYAHLEGGMKFPVPLKAPEITAIIKEWLETIDYKKVYNQYAHGDGTSSPGWLICSGSRSPFDWRWSVEFAVRPVWNYYGK